MAIKSLQHSSLTDNIFYRSLLAGNEYYAPFIPADDILEEIVLTSSASSVTFSGLGAYTDYQHLQIRMTVRGSQGTNATQSFMYFNSDTTFANYASHALRGPDSSVTSTAILGTLGGVAFVTRHSAANETANAFSPGVIDILDFADTSKNTTARILAGNAGAEQRIDLVSGVYLQTSAVTSITIEEQFSGTNFVAGSRFSLIGVR